MSRRSSCSVVKCTFPGIMYQVGWLALFSKRAVDREYSFHLFTEKESAKDFDDIVLRYEQDGKIIHRFIQTKHKKGRNKKTSIGNLLTLGKGGAFGLIKYLIAYLKIKSNGEFEGEIGDFVIVTNADLDSTDSILHPVRKLRMMSSGKNEGKEVSVIRVDTQDEFLDVGNGTKYKFDSSIISYLQENKDFIKHEIGREVSDEEIEDFLNKLVFAVNLPSGTELCEIIKSEFCKEFSNIDAKHFYSCYQEEVLKLMEEEGERFLSYEEAKALSEKIREEILGAVRFEIIEPVASFTGRGKVVIALHNVLQKSAKKQVVISQAAAISGLGGIGKSELARKYAYKYGKDYYGNVIWINAENFEYMKNSFLRLAEDKRVDISPKDKHGRDKTIEAIVEEIYAFFARRERESLFIFDNAEEYKDIRRFLPSSLSLGCKKTYILITSRNKNWRIAESEGEIKTIQLGVFKEMEAVKFVKRALNIRDNLQDEEIKKLTQELQYFPLALGQAVAYINEKNIVLSYRGKEKIGVSDYLKKYEEEAEKLLDFESKYKSDRYTKTTFITWKITIDAIAQKECGSEALNVLEIMAYLAPDKIYIEEIFSKLVTNNEEKLWSAVELLDRYSIIDLKEGVANIHRLVQRVTELSLQKEGREEEVLRKALELISSDDLAQDSISHVASIWGYSSKHSRLIDDFYFSSSYTCRGVLFIRKNAPLHLLAANDGYEAISTIIPHIERHYPSKLREIVNVENNCGQTPLHIAAENGWLNIVKYLIDKDANINAKGEYGWTPLHIAAKNGKLDMIKYLTNKGANINAKDECYSTPLHLVAELGELSIVEYLINKGAYVDARDGWYRTPLFYAADSGKLGVAEYLVEKNANVNARNEYGSTPLYLATMKGKVDVVKILLKYDADVNAENNEGITVLYCATIGENLAVVEHLIERGANVNAKSKGIFFCGTPLHMAALRGNLEIVRHLVNKGADINAKNRYNETSLHYAAKNGSLKVVEYLVGKGICFDVSTEIGNTLLHFAVKSGRPEVVKYFVEKDIDVNVENKCNETPLHHTVRSGNLEITEYLIEEGANVNAKDKNGNTPLHFAAIMERVNIAKILLKHNADVNAKNNEGRTALYYAAKYNHQELEELLLAHGAAFY